MKLKRVIVVLLLLALCICVYAAGAARNRTGDVNGDGAINQQDVTDLWSNVVNGASQDIEVQDLNGDGVVNLKDVTLLQRYLAGGWDVELPEATAPLAEDLQHYEMINTVTSEKGVACTAFRYGESVLGRDLVCWSLQQGSFSRTVLLNFAIHGWEDSYASDGQLLVDLGNALVEHYSQTTDLQDCRLLIIPCANPDGIADGTTNNGFGRCNAEGVDLNRDFDASHVVYTNARNYTSAPFSAVESRALRDLVLAANPAVVVDFHGWLNYTIGNSELAEVFSTYLGINHKYELTTGAHGYFSYWAQLQGAEAILVEFKDTTSIVTEDVILAVDQLVANNYGSRQDVQELDPNYSQYDSIVAYALGTGRVYTQKQAGNTGTDYGYIVGGADECRLLQIYNNGWCKVNYPVGDLTKTGYCELSAFISPETAVSHYSASTSTNTNVYSSVACTEKIGSVWSTDVFTVVACSGSLAQIIYPLDDGGYKMGWIDASLIQVNQ